MRKHCENCPDCQEEQGVGCQIHHRQAGAKIPTFHCAGRLKKGQQEDSTQ